MTDKPPDHWAELTSDEKRSGMTLLTPLSEKDAEAWVLRFLAHYVLGQNMWHSLIWTMHPAHAVWFVALAYFFAWEGVVQRFGAGLWDAFTDALAVTLGALAGYEIMHTTPWSFMALLCAGSGALYYGVWRRS